MRQNDIGLIGLAVMGQNLALNMARTGQRIAVYNRTPETTRRFMAERGTGAKIAAYETLKLLVVSLKRPRRVFLMVKAGPTVDAVIDELKLLLSPGDLVMDGGNSFYLDTERRSRELTDTCLKYLGVGVSGGEEGALKGPSMMVGGDRDSYALVAPLFQAVAARFDDDPCVARMGTGGAGHLVKMVHNGIEYGDMQLIAEVYDFLNRGRGLSAPKLHRVFDAWNRAELSSYLMEITADIFTVRDDSSDVPLVDCILDAAGQKGTGRWTVQTALELGVPVPTISAAVEARIISSQRAIRQKAAKVLSGPTAKGRSVTPGEIDKIGKALYAAKICCYAQGIALMRAADHSHDFGVNLVDTARVWRAGCIIRSVFLNDVMAALERQPDLENLLMNPFFTGVMNRTQGALRRVVAQAAEAGIPCPALSASLGYYDALRADLLPANLIQAQRDYFGAHTYERIDREGVFHTDWAGRVDREDL